MEKGITYPSLCYDVAPSGSAGRDLNVVGAVFVNVDRSPSATFWEAIREHSRTRRKTVPGAI